MQNLLGIYELRGCFVPELNWYRNQADNVEVTTNNRHYLIYETIENKILLVVQKVQGMQRMGTFEVNTLDNGKALAERIEGFYCSMEKIDMVCEFEYVKGI